jgi:tRNA pseudouridine55 synthase
LINGIINVYKEKGYTSHDVVAKLRGILKQKKIGHTGTLDPDAEGVLPVCLGNGTKVCDMLTDRDKTYQAVLLLGQSTDTQDVTGTILSTSEVNVDRKSVEKTILSFIGEYNQLPPMYSAIKINGKRLYELAREGKEVERETRKVWIHNIQILNYDGDKHEISMLVDCSKGTYIRTLCHDIGEKLQCGGCMKSLLRTKVGQFTIDNSLKLSDISELVQQDKFTELVIQTEDMFSEYPKVYVAEEYCRFLYNGNNLQEKYLTEQSDELISLDKNTESFKVRVYDWQNNFTAIYQFNNEKETFEPYKMFL